MAISDVVVGNITSLYLVLILAMKLFGLITGQTYTGFSVLLVSTTIVVLMVVVTLSWDVSRKAATYGGGGGGRGRGGRGGGESGHMGHKCRGGICWHGTVSVGTTVSQVRFRLPRHFPDPLAPSPSQSSSSLLLA